jgi:hypothetical protein
MVTCDEDNAPQEVNSLLEQARDLLTKIQEATGVHVFSIVYNPYKEGIKTPLSTNEKDDAWYINAALEHSKITDANVILHGPGGDFKIGMKMAYTLRKYLKNYKTIVPSICCSALCFCALKSDQLEINDKSKITQIDPLFEEDGQLLRAVEVQFCEEETRRHKAKKILSACKEQIMQLIKEKPSLYNHRKVEWEEVYDVDQISDRFMWKPDHLEGVSFEEMGSLNLKVKKNEDPELINLMKKYVELCQEILIYEDRRVIIGCSKRYAYVSGPEGNFLRIP